MDSQRRKALKEEQQRLLRALTFGNAPSGAVNMMAGMHSDAMQKYIGTFRDNIVAEFRLFSRLHPLANSDILELFAGRPLYSDPSRSLDCMLESLLVHVGRKCQPVAPWRDLLLIEWGLSKSCKLPPTALDSDDIIACIERAEEEEFDLHFVAGSVCFIRIATDLYLSYPDVDTDFTGFAERDEMLAIFFEPTNQTSRIASLE